MNLYVNPHEDVWIDGVGVEAPTEVNEVGAKQSASPYRFDLIDPITLFALARIVKDGAEKYGEWNWQGLKIDDNLNHALIHIFAYMAGDQQDEHLEHAFTRLMFALSQHLGQK